MIHKYDEFRKFSKKKLMNKKSNLIQNQNQIKNTKPKNPKQTFNVLCVSDNLGLCFQNRFYRSKREYNINNQRHQIEKKVLGRDENFSTKSSFAEKK